MSLLQSVIGVLLILVGFTFMLLGSIGILRLPDFFSRTHAASKVDTVGIIVVLMGVAVLEGFTLTGGKVLLAGVFIALTNPVAAHALARAAMRKGLRPWRRGEPKTPTEPHPHSGD